MACESTPQLGRGYPCYVLRLKSRSSHVRFEGESTGSVGVYPGENAKPFPLKAIAQRSNSAEDVDDCRPHGLILAYLPGLVDDGRRPERSAQASVLLGRCGRSSAKARSQFAGSTPGDSIPAPLIPAIAGCILASRSRACTQGICTAEARRALHG